MTTSGWPQASRPHSYSDASSAIVGGGSGGGSGQVPNTPSPTAGSHVSHQAAPNPPTITLSMENTSREDFTILAKEGALIICIYCILNPVALYNAVFSSYI